MQRRHLPPQAFFPGTLPPLPPPPSILQPPYAMGSLNPPYFLPQPNYYQMCVRFPYSYPQYTCPGIPGSGMGIYRLVTPLNAMPPPPSLRYQIPPGYHLVPPPYSSQPTVPFPSQNFARHQTSSVNNNPTMAEGSEGLGEDIFDTMFNVVDRSPHTLSRNPKKQRGKKQRREKKGVAPARYQHFRGRARYPTNFRLNSGRRRALNSKNTYSSLHSSSCATDLSSIAKIIYQADDEEYETCDEKDEVKMDFDNIKHHQCFKDAQLKATSTAHSSNDTTEYEKKYLEDYTFITNDKSYSHVNFNPSMLPVTLGHMWLESGDPSFVGVHKNKVENNKEENWTDESNVDYPGNKPSATCSKNAATTSDVHRSSSLRNKKETEKKMHTLAGDCNNNCQQEKEMWWDNSTDVGYKSSCINFPDNQQKPKQSVDGTDESSTSRKSIVTDVDNFVGTYDKQPETVVTSNVDDASNNIHKGIEYKNPSKSPKTKISQFNSLPTAPYDSLNHPRKRLDANGNTTRNTVSPEYMVGTFNKKELSDANDVSIAAVNDKYVDSTLSDLAARKLVDDDQAIVTVIYHNLSVKDFENAASKNKQDKDYWTCSKAEDVQNDKRRGLSDLAENVQQKQVDIKKISPGDCVVSPKTSSNKENLKVIFLTSTASTSATTWCPGFFSTPACSNTENQKEIINPKNTALRKPVLQSESSASESSQSNKDVPKDSHIAVVSLRGAKSLPCSPLHSRQRPSGFCCKNCSFSLSNLSGCTPGSLLIDCSRFNAAEETKVHTPHPKAYKNNLLSATFSLQAKDKANAYVITPICSNFDKMTNRASAMLKKTDKITFNSSFVNNIQQSGKGQLVAHLPSNNNNFPHHITHCTSNFSTTSSSRNETAETKKKSQFCLFTQKLPMSDESDKANVRLCSNVASKILGSLTCSSESIKTNVNASTQEMVTSFAQPYPHWKKATDKQKQRKFSHGKKKCTTVSRDYISKDSLSTYPSVSKSFAALNDVNKEQNKSCFTTKLPPGLQYSKKEFAPSTWTISTNIIDETSPEKVFEDLIVPIKEAVISSKYMEKAPNSSSSTKVSLRRSPRDAHSTLLKVKAPKANANELCDTSVELCSRKLQLSTDLVDAFQKNEKKQETKACENNENEQLHSTQALADFSRQNKFLFTSASYTIPSQSPAIISANSKSSKTFLTHGKVKSSIKSIVNNLVCKSASDKVHPPVSPCLAALQAGGSSRLRDVVLFKRTVPSNTILSKLKKRSNSVPTSPANSSLVEISQRSASLSDVFYDSTLDNSTISLLASHSSGEKEKCLLNPNSKKNSKFRSTYISFSPPTMTPPNKQEAKKDSKQRPLKQGEDIIVTKKCLVELKDADKTKCDQKEDKNEQMEHSFDWDRDKPVKRILDQNVEEEIRKSAEMLLDSVLEVSYPILKSQKPSMVGTRELLSKVAAGPTPTKNSEELLAGMFSSSGISLQDNEAKLFAHRWKSTDKCTQTAKLVPLKDQQNQLLENQLVTTMFKLKVPPKKPPRSNSPNSLRDATQKETFLDKKQSKFIEKNATITLADVENNIAVPFVSLRSFLNENPKTNSDQQKLHYTSSTSGLAGNLEQCIVNGSCIPSVTWNSTIQSNSLDENSKEGKAHQGDRVCAIRKPATSVEQSAYLTQTPVAVPVLNALKMPNSVVRFNKNVRFPPKVNVNPKPLYILPPAHLRFPLQYGAPSFQHLLPKRRRSFSGISSASVAKARLNRRFLNHVTKRTKFWKHPFAPDLNYSHPAMHRRIRRPRFVRSSLTDDTVFESVKENCQVFVTKPLNKKISTSSLQASDLALDKKYTEEKEEQPNKHKEPVENDFEAGCSSEIAVSSSTQPAVAENPALHPSVGLDTILEDYSQIEMEKKDEIEKTVSGDALMKTSFDASEIKEPKKGQKFSTLQRLKRYVSGSIKGGKQEPGLRPRRWKTDSKLPRKETSSSNIKRDHIRDIFRKSKKVISEDDNESTFKADVTAINRSAATPKANDPSQTLLLRETYDLKSSLFKPSFVVLSTAEARTKDLSNTGGDISSDQAVDELTDCTAATIRRHSDQQSVSTPGVRINSETGDLMEEAKHDAGKEPERFHKLLSSTAIDEGSYLPINSSVSTGNSGSALHGRDSDATGSKKVLPEIGCDRSTEI